MQDGSSKGSIDLDKLVNTLLKEKNGEAGSSIEPMEQSTSPNPSVSPAETAPKPGVAETPVLESVPASEPLSIPLITSSDELNGRRRSHRAKKNRRRDSLFKRREESSYEDEWSDWGLTPIGHFSVEDEQPLPAPERETDMPCSDSQEDQKDVEETKPSATCETTPEVESAPEPTPTVDEFPSITPVAETITLPLPPIANAGGDAQATKVIPSANPEASEVVTAEPNMTEGEQLPDQLSLEEMVRVEDVEESVSVAADANEDPEERFHRSRLEKVRDFTLNGVEEEENEPEEEPEEEPEDEPIIEDFTSYEDSKAVSLELQYRSRTGLLSLIVTSVLEAVLLVLTFVSVYMGASPITNIGYLSAQIFALILMTVLNYGSVMRGLSGLFTLKANNDSLPAFVLLFSTLGVAIHFVDLSQSLPLWTPLAGIPMLLVSIAQQVRTSRIRRNFKFVSYNGEKYAAALIADEKPLREIGQHVVIDGQARVAYFRRANFLTDFLNNSYGEDASDRWSTWLTPCLIILSVLVSAILLLSGRIEGAWSFLHTLAYILCLSCAPLALAVQMPLSQCSRRMLRQGGFIVGWKAVDDFGKPDALVVDVADLYPDECMLLHGIKTFSGMQIDTAILDAASLSIRSGGPLSLVFRRIIQDKTELLRNVENLVYEQGMGLSGWVDGHRVLVGNRRLLSNHGVDVPSADYEARYAKNGRRLVYLSSGGNLSAMFVVSYLPDNSIKAVLHDLCRAKVTVLVRSCDQNVTAAELCESFDLDEYYVEVLPASAGRLYEQLVSNTAENTPAIMASNGHIIGTAEAISACRSVRIKSRIALIVSTLFSLLAIVFGVVWASDGMIPHDISLVFVLLSTFFPLLIPLFKRI